MAISAPAPSRARVVLDGVHAQINENFALQNIRLDVGAGEFFCLLGPSGSGKSSLLGVIGGWIATNSGRVVLDGRDVTSVGSNQRPVRTCFQRGLLFPHMTVAENVGYALRVKRVSPESVGARVLEVLTLLELASMADRYPRQLSGGEAQRVSIARALADPQPIVLLDEIEAGLDQRLRRAVREIILKLVKQDDVSVLLVSHDSREALALASSMDARVGVMNDGRLLQSDLAKNLYEDPSSSLVARLTGTANLILVRELAGRRIVGEGGGAFDMAVDATPCRYLLFRPESVSFSKPQGPSMQMTGVVADREFLGSETRITLRIAGDTVQVLASNAMTSTADLGPQVTVYVPQGAIRLLND